MIRRSSVSFKFRKITHCAGGITAPVECGMSVYPPAAVALRGGRHCEETHHEQRQRSHCEVTAGDIAASGGENERECEEGEWRNGRRRASIYRARRGRHFGPKRKRASAWVWCGAQPICDQAGGPKNLTHVASESGFRDQSAWFCTFPGWAIAVFLRTVL